MGNQNSIGRPSGSEDHVRIKLLLGDLKLQHFQRGELDPGCSKEFENEITIRGGEQVKVQPEVFGFKVVEAVKSRENTERTKAKQTITNKSKNRMYIYIEKYELSYYVLEVKKNHPSNNPSFDPTLLFKDTKVWDVTSPKQLNALFKDELAGYYLDGRIPTTRWKQKDIRKLDKIKNNTSLSRAQKLTKCKEFFWKYISSDYSVVEARVEHLTRDRGFVLRRENNPKMEQIVEFDEHEFQNKLDVFFEIQQ